MTEHAHDSDEATAGEVVPVEVVPDDEPAPPARTDGPAVVEPGKLLRIATMLREVREEARRAPTDERGRDRLRVVHERALTELCEGLGPQLREELEAFTLPFGDGTPSESEILIAQASLLGWLEGLFQGIQAAIFTQQAQAQQQLEAMRQRGLPAGRGAEPANPTGQYL